jgi:signal-transduction protein with cAMP-binding, CBS, and nucleotidyltransferase domain
MTTQVFAVTPHTSVWQIADTFERERIRRVPVVADGVVVGIVSRTNLVQALAQVRHLYAVQESVSDPLTIPSVPDR